MPNTPLKRIIPQMGKLVNRFLKKIFKNTNRANRFHSLPVLMLRYTAFFSLLWLASGVPWAVPGSRAGVRRICVVNVDNGGVRGGKEKTVQCVICFRGFGERNRFTVCSLWPLGKSPLKTMKQCLTMK